MRLHEDIGRGRVVPVFSERAFGLTLSGVFLLLGLMPVLNNKHVHAVYLVIAGVLFILALGRPSLLRPLSRAWARIGEFLNSIVSPLVLGVLLLLVFTPVSLFLRLRGKDPLRLRHDRDARSYWIERSPPGPDPKTMSNQF